MPRTKSAIERIVDDVKSGKNIDLYASVVVAFVLIVLNIFGVVNQEYFVPVALAILAILTYTTLNLKHDISEVREYTFAGTTRQEFISDFPPEFQSQLDAAHDVWFSGTHLSSALTAYHELLLNKLKRHGKLRFLLVSPDGHSALLAAKRFPGTVPPDQERIRIRTSLTTLAELAKASPDQVEIRVIDFPIEYTTFFIDPESPSAVLYVERATYKISGGIHKPKFIFRRHDGKWFDHVANEVRLLWNDATVWKQ
jgi:hypothetical protein